MIRLNEVTSELFLFLTSFRRSLGHEHFDATWVKSRVKSLLEIADRRATADPETHRLFVLAKYPLVVTIDGVILNSGWPGADRWTLLEIDLFGSGNGGERFFELVDDAQYRDPQLQELLFTCLATGFSGKFGDDPYGLRAVRQTIYHGLSGIPREGEDRITPTAYDRTPMEGRRSLPLTSVLRMTLVVLGILVVLGVGAHLLYKNSVKDLIAATRRVAQVFDLRWDS